MNARRARLDIGLHQFEGIERSAEACFRVCDDWRKPCVHRQAIAFRRFDLVGALQSTVDPLGQFRSGIGRIERLVGIHGRGRVGVGGDLPAGKIDRLQPGADHLHGLVAGKRAQRVDEIVLVNELPQAVGAHFCQRVLDVDGAAQLLHVFRRVGALDAVEAALRCGRDEIVEIGHVTLLYENPVFACEPPASTMGRIYRRFLQ